MTYETHNHGAEKFEAEAAHATSIAHNADLSRKGIFPSGVIIGALIVFLAVATASAYTPAPAVSTPAVMQNFLDIAQEIERRDLTKGGVVNANVVFSSSARVQGDTTFNGSAAFNGQVTLSSTVTGAYNIAWASATAQQTISATTWTGLTGSSATISVNGLKRVRITGGVPATTGGSAGVIRVRVLHGDNILTHASANGDCSGTIAANDYATCSFNALTVPLHAGSTTFSLQVYASASADIIPANFSWIVYAEEIR